MARNFQTPARIPSRRGVVLGGAALISAGAAGLVRAAPAAPGSACVATPRATEGPFWFDPELNRADVTEDRAGVPLDLSVAVLGTGACAAVPDARVDIWQCDAAGLYSGYARQGYDGRTDARGETFLRGWQATGDGGLATFRTIYPGTYPIRPTHIHLKVFLGDSEALTAQIYFPEDFTREVYRGRDVYADSIPSVQPNEGDRIFRRGGQTMVAEMGEADGVLTAKTTVIVRA